MSSSKTPCAACKTLRRKCIEECVFAPYFPPDQPHRFESVHKVYGASNVAKILSDLQADERVDAVNSLVYEAEARLQNPVYGCVGSISILQHKLKQIQTQIQSAKQELATYLGTTPQFQNQQQQQQMQHRQMDISRSNSCFGHIGPSSQHDHQLYAHQKQQLLQQQQMNLSRFNRRFDGAGPSGDHDTLMHRGAFGPKDSNVTCQIQRQT